jgi:hypothetical protein
MLQVTFGDGTMWLRGYPCSQTSVVDMIMVVQKIILWFSYLRKQKLKKYNSCESGYTDRMFYLHVTFGILETVTRRNT